MQQNYKDNTNNLYSLDISGDEERDALNEAALISNFSSCVAITAEEAVTIRAIAYGEIGTNSYKTQIDPGTGYVLMTNGLPPDENYIAQSNGTWLFVANTCCCSRCEEVNTLLSTKLALGFTYSSVVYQIDTDSQTELLKRSLYATNSILDSTTYPWDSPYNSWTAKNNVSQSFATAESFQAFSKAVSDYCNGMWITHREHKDALMLLTVESEILAYDITTGWPV